MKCPYCKGSGKTKNQVGVPAANSYFEKEIDCEHCVKGEIVCFDSDGNEITVGDKVIMTFEVANVQARYNPVTGDQDRADIEVLRVLDTGERVHMATHDSKSFTKA